jgi:hypothetical protein
LTVSGMLLFPAADEDFLDWYEAVKSFVL